MGLPSLIVLVAVAVMPLTSAPLDTTAPRDVGGISRTVQVGTAGSRWSSVSPGQVATCGLPSGGAVSCWAGLRGGQPYGGQPYGGRLGHGAVMV